MAMSPLIYLTPLWFVLEIAHLVLSERYLGVKQIERGIDPRTTGPSEPVAFLWTCGIVAYWLWLVGMLFQPVGRLQVAAMLLFTLIGYGLRRVVGLKWVLVVLTFEGAIRIGMLISLAAFAWRRM